MDTKEMFTKESLKAYKSLEAYNYFYSGCIQTVYHYTVSQEIGVLKARVNPSQKAPDKGHLAWIVINSGGDMECCIQVAQCTCMAGQVFKPKCMLYVALSSMHSSAVKLEWYNGSFL